MATGVTVESRLLRDILHLARKLAEIHRKDTGERGVDSRALLRLIDAIMVREHLWPKEE